MSSTQVPVLPPITAPLSVILAKTGAIKPKAPITKDYDLLFQRVMVNEDGVFPPAAVRLAKTLCKWQDRDCDRDEVIRAFILLKDK